MPSVSAAASASPATSTTPTTAIPVLDEPPPILGDVQELVGIDTWLQADQASLAGLDSQVRIVQFWTFGCRNCKATIPTLQRLYATDQSDGLEIVGVHSPEFSYEKDLGNVQQAADDLGVSWPIAIDNSKKNFFGWQGSPAYWPRTYVVDAEGKVRFDHIGEGAYEELEATVAYLLQEAAE
jgi:thiol-disulfide isomerase/thioredoxin